MKTSRILLSLLALATIVGCSEGNDENQVVNPNEGDVSYLAVKLKAAGDLSRAEDSDFEEGSDAENAVENAVFFFFDADGNPANVIKPLTGPNVNYYSTELTFTTESSDANIEEVADPVVVISGYKEAVPTQMFTILNYTYDGAPLTLNQVRGLQSDIKSTSGKFVMATSVYAEDSEDVVTSTISGVNVANSESAASASPVVVHVERLASKVTLTVAEPDGFDLAAQAAEKDVKVKVLNWGLVSTQDKTKIVKDIEPTWTDGAIGFAWNDPTHYRSYWATSVNDWGPDFNKFKLNEMLSEPADSEYCGENTYAVAADRTKVVVIAQLQDKSTSASVELAKWLGVQYAGEDALLQAVAGTLASTIFSGVDDGVGGTTYTSISKDDIKCVATAGYTVTFAPSAAGATKVWSSKSGATYTTINIATELAKIAPAQVYKNGKTYYTVDVRHLAPEGSGNDGEFGVVRNHSYKIKITNIVGFGTPIYNMEQEIVNPEDPADHESYIASEVKILAWRLVNQNAVLGE
ncbi:MAG: Mfa1 fimbrilin C-terminal domain-containing protein [Alistipes sp.]|nr:Mfa1 fimbrilin C-terminal domain-containing protein [Alistipes sp.]